MIIEGRLEFDRLDDGGDVWAAKVWPDGHSDDDPAVVIEVMSVLGEAWWDAMRLAEPTVDPRDKAAIGEHHPEWVRSLVGKRVRITIEEVS